MTSSSRAACLDMGVEQWLYDYLGRPGFDTDKNSPTIPERTVDWITAA